MKFRIHLLLSLFLLGNVCVAQSAVPEAAVPADKEQFKLFLLVGQSNMAGRGRVSRADRLPAERVLVLDAQDQWVHQGEPVHFDKPEIAGVGLGFTFAKLVAASEPEVTVGLIPCAVGGTPVSRWLPGGDLFDEAVRRAKIAQRSGTLAGILWHQGESESASLQQAAAYAENLSRVIEGFRKALDAPELPVVVGELGRFLYTRTNADGQLESPHAERLNESIHVVPHRISHAGVVSSEGLNHNGDVLHFNAASLKTFGNRYFDAYEKLIGSSD